MNDDFARPSSRTLRDIIDTFEREGYRVGLNTPYSNAIQPVADDTPMHTPYFSFMVEINKRTYMDEQTITLNDCFHRMRHTLLCLYERLLGE